MRAEAARAQRARGLGIAPARGMRAVGRGGGLVGLLLTAAKRRKADQDRAGHEGGQGDDPQGAVEGHVTRAGRSVDDDRVGALEDRDVYKRQDPVTHRKARGRS